ncbi:uncharacterized protein RB166_014320 [Leptodactylus fuscus]
MVVLIALSIRLSQVSERHHNTMAELQDLQGEHDDLGSSFIQNNLRKDAIMQSLKEAQRETKQALDKTSAELQEVQEKWRTTTQELQRTTREKEDTAAALRRLQDVLQSTETQLRGKQEELRSCEDELRSISSQKMTADRSLTETRSSLQTTLEKLRAKETSLLQKDRELSKVRSNLQDMQNKLDEKTKYSEQEKKMWSNLEQRLRDAGKCFTNMACSDVLDTDGSTPDFFDFCPPGWQQIDDMCYYFSNERKPRVYAEYDCEQRSAQLAKVDDEDSSLMDLIKKLAGGYWIGLHKSEKGSWMWPDQSVKEGFHGRSDQMCARASPRLAATSCRTLLPWICQTTATTCGSSAKTLRCLGEKSGVIGARYPEQ